MFQRIFLIFSLLCLPLTNSFAADATADARLKQAVSQVLQAAKNSPNSDVLAQNIRPVLENYLSFEAMTRMAVGLGWKSFTDEQRHKATVDFATLIIRTYGDKLTPGELPVIDIQPAKQLGQGKVEIPTTLQYKGSRYEVTYRMQKLDDWRVTDVVIEGVSFVANYRSQFDALFKKGGAAAVLSSLNQSISRKQ